MTHNGSRSRAVAILDVGDRIQFSKIERTSLVFCEVVKYLIVCLA